MAGMLFAGCLPATVEISTIRTPVVVPTLTEISPQFANETLLPSPHHMAGNLTDQIARLIAFTPDSGSEGFLEPESWELIAFGQLVNEIQYGNFEQAINQATDLDYELIEYTDRGDENARNYLLREETPIRKGWGLFVIRIDSASNLIIEAPHPHFDLNTPTVTLDLFRALKARALLIAGAHRGAKDDFSADVAHNPQTIFQAVHETLAESEGNVILQIHGFASSKHPGYPQVVLGNNQTTNSNLVDDLAAAFVAGNISVGVCDGTSWLDLCGQTNVQLISTNAGIFIHLELNETIRDSPQVLTSVLGQVFRR